MTRNSTIKQTKSGSSNERKKSPPKFGSIMGGK